MVKIMIVMNSNDGKKIMIAMNSYDGKNNDRNE